MNLVLRMIRGPHVGTCRVLQIGQSAFIGSSDRCDFPVVSVPIGDPQFLIQCTRDGCLVQNMFQAVKLMVNGVLTSRKRLADGDVISVGACEFIVQIRGLVSRLQRMRIPLVGTQEFSQSFSQSLQDRQTDSGILETSRNTIHPSFWSDSIRRSQRGRGRPSTAAVVNGLAGQHVGMLVDWQLAGQLSFLSAERQQRLRPISSGNDAPSLYLLAGLTEPERKAVVSALWDTGQLILFIPTDGNADWNGWLQESLLWQHRSVRQVSRILIEGSLALREGVFRYLERLLLPTESGWVLLSSTRIRDSVPSSNAG